MYTNYEYGHISEEIVSLPFENIEYHEERHYSPYRHEILRFSWLF